MYLYDVEDRSEELARGITESEVRMGGWNAICVGGD